MVWAGVKQEVKCVCARRCECVHGARWLDESRAASPLRMDPPRVCKRQSFGKQEENTRASICMISHGIFLKRFF